MAKSPDKNNSTADSGPNGAKSSRKKVIMLTALILAVIAISVGSTLVLVKKFGTPPPAAETATVNGDRTNALGKMPAIYYPLQPVFIVNFETQGRQRFLQAELNLMLRDSSIIPALELHMPAIRNSLVMLFSGQIYEDLQTAEGKELLRQQALLKVQEVLTQEIGKPGVEQVLFTNFVMQ